MSSFYKIVEIILSVLIVIVVILQQRGTGSSMAFGGNGESYRSKKGIERVLFYSTIILAACFAVVSILGLING